MADEQESEEVEEEEEDRWGIEENSKPYTHEFTRHPSQDFPWPRTKLLITHEKIF